LDGPALLERFEFGGLLGEKSFVLPAYAYFNDEHGLQVGQDVRLGMMVLKLPYKIKLWSNDARVLLELRTVMDTQGTYHLNASKNGSLGQLSMENEYTELTFKVDECNHIVVSHSGFVIEIS